MHFPPEPNVLNFNKCGVWTDVNYASNFVSAINLLIGVNYKALNASFMYWYRKVTVFTLDRIYLPSRMYRAHRKSNPSRIGIDISAVYRVLHKILASIKDHICLQSTSEMPLQQIHYKIQIVYSPSCAVCHHWRSMNFHALCLTHQNDTGGPTNDLTYTPNVFTLSMAD